MEFASEWGRRKRSQKGRLGHARVLGGQRSASGEITSAPHRQSRLPGRSAAWRRASRPPPPCSPAAAGRTRSGAGQRDEGHAGAQRPSSPEARPARSVRSSDATRPSSRPSQHPHTLSSCPTRPHSLWEEEKPRPPDAASRWHPRPSDGTARPSNGTPSPSGGTPSP